MAFRAALLCRGGEALPALATHYLLCSRQRRRAPWALPTDSSLSYPTMTSLLSFDSFQSVLHLQEVIKDRAPFVAPYRDTHQNTFLVYYLFDYGDFLHEIIFIF